MQGNPSARSRRANRSPQHNHGSSLATSLFCLDTNARNKNQWNQSENMNESTINTFAFMFLKKCTSPPPPPAQSQQRPAQQAAQQSVSAAAASATCTVGHWQVQGMTTVFFVYIADLYQIIRSIMYVSICIDIKNNISKILKKRHRTKSHTKNRKNN